MPFTDQIMTNALLAALALFVAIGAVAFLISRRDGAAYRRDRDASQGEGVPAGIRRDDWG